MPSVSAFAAVELYKPYVAGQLAAGVHLAAITRHMLGLFQGLPGARAWRRILTVDSVARESGLEVIDWALAAVRDGVAQREARWEAAAAGERPDPA